MRVCPDVVGLVAVAVLVLQVISVTNYMLVVGMHLLRKAKYFTVKGFIVPFLITSRSNYEMELESGTRTPLLILQSRYRVI